jgi:CHAD domain-containing protein
MSGGRANWINRRIPPETVYESTTMGSDGTWIDGVSRDDRVTRVAARALKSRLRAVRAYLPLAAKRADEDVEYVHKLRVWTRRADAALRLFGDLLPTRKLRWLKKQLKKIRKAADEARDADVLAMRLEKLQDDPQVAIALQKDRHRRHKAQRPIVDVNKKLKSGGQLKNRVKELHKRVRFRPENNAPFTQAEPCFGDWADQKMESLHAKFFEAAQQNLHQPAALHQFRIRGKELRYAIELLAAAYPPALRDEIYPEIQKLQSRLGRINDHFVAQDRYRRWIAESENVEATESFETLLSREQDQVETRLENFFKWWTPAREQSLKTRFDQLLAGRQSQSNVQPLPPTPAHS